MGLYEAAVAGVVERARRDDVSAWEKASDLIELQSFLRIHGEPSGDAHVARLTGLPERTVAQRLVIAASLSPEVLESAAVAAGDLARLPHGVLLRVALLPPSARAATLSRMVGASARVTSSPPPDDVATRARSLALHFERLRTVGELEVSVGEPLAHLSPAESQAYLDLLAPTLANLAENAVGRQPRAHYVGLTGNGGLIVYIGPESDEPV